jgi:hypothetical protein
MDAVRRGADRLRGLRHLVPSSLLTSLILVTRIRANRGFKALLLQLAAVEAHGPMVDGPVNRNETDAIYKEDGAIVFREACRLGCEGIVSKSNFRNDSTRSHFFRHAEQDTTHTELQGPTKTIGQLTVAAPAASSFALRAVFRSCTDGQSALS